MNTKCNCDEGYQCSECELKQEGYVEEMLRSYRMEYIPPNPDMRNEHKKSRWGGANVFP